MEGEEERPKSASYWSLAKKKITVDKQMDHLQNQRAQIEHLKQQTGFDNLDEFIEEYNRREKIKTDLCNEIERLNQQEASAKESLELLKVQKGLLIEGMASGLEGLKSRNTGLEEQIQRKKKYANMWKKETEDMVAHIESFSGSIGTLFELFKRKAPEEKELRNDKGMTESEKLSTIEECLMRMIIFDAAENYKEPRGQEILQNLIRKGRIKSEIVQKNTAKLSYTIQSLTIRKGGQQGVLDDEDEDGDSRRLSESPVHSADMFQCSYRKSSKN